MRSSIFLRTGGDTFWGRIAFDPVRYDTEEGLIYFLTHKSGALFLTQCGPSSEDDHTHSSSPHSSSFLEEDASTGSGNKAANDDLNAHNRGDDHHHLHIEENKAEFHDEWSTFEKMIVGLAISVGVALGLVVLVMIVVFCGGYSTSRGASFNKMESDWEQDGEWEEEWNEEDWKKWEEGEWEGNEQWQEGEGEQATRLETIAENSNEDHKGVVEGDGIKIQGERIQSTTTSTSPLLLKKKQKSKPRRRRRIQESPKKNSMKTVLLWVSLVLLVLALIPLIAYTVIRRNCRKKVEKTPEQRLNDLYFDDQASSTVRSRSINTDKTSGTASSSNEEGDFLCIDTTAFVSIGVRRGFSSVAVRVKAQLNGSLNPYDSTKNPPTRMSKILYVEVDERISDGEGRLFHAKQYNVDADDLHQNHAKDSPSSLHNRVGKGRLRLTRFTPKDPGFPMAVRQVQSALFQITTAQHHALNTHIFTTSAFT